MIQHPDTKHGSIGPSREKGRQAGNSIDRFTAETARRGATQAAPRLSASISTASPVRRSIRAPSWTRWLPCRRRHASRASPAPLSAKTSAPFVAPGRDPFKGSTIQPFVTILGRAALVHTCPIAEMEVAMTNWLQHQIEEVTATDDNNADVIAAGIAVVATVATFATLWTFAL
jgi:hypothetical protein